ncbi:MAG TPA: glycosyltransferase [Rhizomicrobium sp.]|nr:glycosyltransferase [Rhizomicrobium sp.]
MACLIKPPQGTAKGVVSFTTPERDQLIRRFPDLTIAVQSLKSRYLVGLHHNWHDADFRHDALFDFNFAGEADLISGNGEFPLVPMDACNFSPPCFAPGQEKFWDVLFVARAVKFKGIPEFFRAIRTLYDRGHKLRVLMLCPVPESGPGTEDGLRTLYEKLFMPDERQLFTFITMEWGYPFPLDLPTLAYFYRASRVFVHSAPDERRCRVATYAWATGIPVVGKPCVGSILPAVLRQPPFFFECQSYEDFPDAICRALTSSAMSADFSAVWRVVSQDAAVTAFEEHFSTLAKGLSTALSALPINANGFDLRLGRHHGLATGPNRIEQDLGAFIQLLDAQSDSELEALSGLDDPERAIAQKWPAPPRQVADASSAPAVSNFLHRLRRMLA